MHCLVVFKDCRPLTGLDYHCTYRHVNVPVDREGMASSEDLFRAFSGAVAEDPYFGRIDLEHGTRKVTPGERWLLNPAEPVNFSVKKRLSGGWDTRGLAWD